MDWNTIFLPTLPLAEILLRGSITYLALILLLRLVLKREAGAVGIADLLVVVLIADAVQNSMSGNAKSIADGLLLVGTILFWNYLLDWAGHHNPVIARLLRPPPLLLVEDGRLLKRNMRKELITEDELMSELREAGVEDLELVEKVYMEGNGRFSVIRKDGQESQRSEPKTLG